MKLYALFNEQLDVSATTKAIKQAHEEAEITVFEGVADPIATPEATPLAVPAAAASALPGQVVGAIDPLVFDDIFPSSGLDADTKSFIQRRLQNGASAVRIEAENADSVRRIVRKHNGQVWPSA
jgi:hypothetical protein